MKKLLLTAIVVLCVFAGYSQINNLSKSFSEKSSIENKLQQNELKVYPNPCKIKKLTVDFQSELISEIQLINITGKKVLVKKYSVPVTKIQLDLSNILNGVYLIHIKTSDKKQLVRKVLVSG